MARGRPDLLRGIELRGFPYKHQLEAIEDPAFPEAPLVLRITYEAPDRETGAPIPLRAQIRLSYMSEPLSPMLVAKGVLYLVKRLLDHEAAESVRLEGALVSDEHAALTGGQDPVKEPAMPKGVCPICHDGGVVQDGDMIRCDKCAFSMGADRAKEGGIEPGKPKTCNRRMRVLSMFAVRVAVCARPDGHPDDCAEAV